MATVSKDLLAQALQCNDVLHLSPAAIEQRLNALGYQLRMFWLGRSDKLNSGDFPLYVALTNVVLDANLSPDYKPMVGGPPLFQDINHRSLEREVIMALKAACKQHQGAGATSLPPRSLNGWFKRIFGCNSR